MPAPPKVSRRPVVCGDFPIRRDGIWYYHVSPIGRKELVRLFAPVLTRDGTGKPSPCVTVRECIQVQIAHSVLI